jgi:hypothetical protein
MPIICIHAVPKYKQDIRTQVQLQVLGAYVLEVEHEHLLLGACIPVDSRCVRPFGHNGAGEIDAYFADIALKDERVGESGLSSVAAIHGVMTHLSVLIPRAEWVRDEPEKSCSVEHSDGVVENVSTC